MFKIGQEVFVARCHQVARWITCPDCFGRLFLTVILGDETQVTIPCQSCALGYNPPSGVIQTYEYAPVVEPRIISGFDCCAERTMYWFQGQGAEKENVFLNAEEAKARANELLAEHSREEEERLRTKAKPHRDWAWHVRHYRREIKEAQERIQRSTEKLNYAKIVAKPEKLAPAS